MSDIKALEKRIAELESRVKKLEEKTGDVNIKDTELMDAYYQKAKEAVIREQKASVIFIQRKLYIDFERASQLLERLERDGIVGPKKTGEFREILVKE